ncbi:MAG: GNAT family N-acetyltransferase [Candidatus Latescibacteria bacterium]|jgi:predicted acetyltransferase|nr:GNAT family N-acetyltransferase [Candidatus Latescibacterota bacterium]
MTYPFQIGALSDDGDVDYHASDHLSASVFTGYNGERAWCARMRRDPTFRSENIRIVRAADGILASQLYVIDRTVRIESSELRMGGIGGVGTDPKYRKQGMASALMRDAEAFMKTNDFDISILFSIPEDYYTRFGYMTVLPEFTTTLMGLARLKTLSAIKSSMQVRKLKPGDITSISGLYAAVHSEVTGSVKRSTAHWKWLTTHPEFNGIAVCDGNRVVAYALIRRESDRVIMHEIGSYPSPQVHDAMIRYLARYTLNSGLTKLCLEVPPDLPFARFSALEFEATQQVVVPKKRGGMARILNLQSTMKKLEKVLTDRLRSSQYRDMIRSMIIDTDIGTIRLAMDAGSVSTHLIPDDQSPQPDLAIPQSALVGLILGLYYPSHIWEVWGRPIPPDILSVLTVLFPKRFPHVTWIDHF